MVINTALAFPEENHAEDECNQRQVAFSLALRIGLLQAGYNIMAVLPNDTYLVVRITQLQPDLIIIDAESDARDVLEELVIVSRDAPRPIVLFTETGNASQLDAAMPKPACPPHTTPCFNKIKTNTAPPLLPPETRSVLAFY